MSYHSSAFPTEVAITSFAIGLPCGCVGIAAGPDGLYFSELYKDLDTTAPNARGANILRIRYVGVSGTCPSCPADFNGTDGLNVQDIFDFLSAWFAGCN